MHILCDTSSILLLIRIAPDMLIDARYECCTINDISEELFQTQRFKQKYSWRNSYKDKIKCLPAELIKKQEVALYYDAIARLNNIGTMDIYTGKAFSLSRRDIRLLACALAHGFKLSTGDRGIKDFALQQFTDIYQGSVSALELINIWIRKKLITWNDERHGYLADWAIQGEHIQPDDQKKVFRRLTGRDYPGS